MIWGFQGINISLVVNAGAGLDITEVLSVDPSIMDLIPKVSNSLTLLYLSDDLLASPLKFCPLDGHSHHGSAMRYDVSHPYLWNIRLF